MKVKIQITKTKSVEWTPPWEAAAATVTDVVGIELNAGLPEGCPAVRLCRKKDGIHVVSVGFIKDTCGSLPTSWDALKEVSPWAVPAAFRAPCAALAVHSPDSSTRQTTAESLQTGDKLTSAGQTISKDGVRSVFKPISDEGSVICASLPEYQVLWARRHFKPGKKPNPVSVQTTQSTLLASLAAQPGFCAKDDEIAFFVSESSILTVCFREGLPILFRDSPGVGGVAAMREAVMMTLGLDESMLEAVFDSNSIIDTRPALVPLLTPIVAQTDLTLDYLKSRLGSDPKRILLMGNAVGCALFERIIGNRLSLPIETPNPFDGLQLPPRAADWKNKYCIGEKSALFLSALGAALAVLEGAK